MHYRCNTFLSISFLLLGISLHKNSIAQKASSDSTKKITPIKSYFKADISYLSNAVYYGRKDSATLPYITASFGYYHKSGAYINGALSYLASADDSRIDLFSLQGGYNFNISKQVSGGVYANKYFYNSSSYTVKSELKGGVGGNISYDPEIIQASAGIDFSFSDQVDFSLNATLSHAFYIGSDENQWTINPSITSFLGTQNFYKAYYKNRKFVAGGTKGRGKKKSSSTGTAASGTVQVQEHSTFTVLNYELSIPVAYDRIKWGLFFTPTYAIPVHPITFTLPNGTKFNVEKLTNVFFVELGGYIKF